VREVGKFQRQMCGVVKSKTRGQSAVAVISSILARTRRMVVAEWQTCFSLVWISSTCMHARTSELRATGGADLILEMIFFRSVGSFSYSLLLAKGSLFEEIILEIVNS
jgi:hypothetical protein